MLQTLFRWLICPTTMAALLLAPPAAADEDFRVETEIYLQEQAEPAARTLTLFHRTTVYDFLLEGNGETTVFDAVRNRILLLDPARQVKTEISSEELRANWQALRRRALQRDDHGFFDAAEIEYQFTEQPSDASEGGGEAGHWPHVASTSVMTYRAKGMTPKPPQAARQYHRFADNMAMVNTMRQPGQAPPFLRLRLNQEIAARGEIPLEVQRVIRNVRQWNAKQVATARHRANWRLSEEDFKRIERVHDWLDQFQSLPVDRYFGIETAAKP